jgi:hypothetical protein
MQCVWRFRDLPRGHLGAELARVEKGVQWCVGDWWAFGKHRYGDHAAAAKGIFGKRSFGGLRNCGSVARAFETSRRRDVLSFEHHREVRKLPPPEADALPRHRRGRRLVDAADCAPKCHGGARQWRAAARRAGVVGSDPLGACLIHT